MGDLTLKAVVYHLDYQSRYHALAFDHEFQGDDDADPDEPGMPEDGVDVDGLDAGSKSRGASCQAFAKTHIE